MCPVSNDNSKHLFEYSQVPRMLKVRRGGKGSISSSWPGPGDSAVTETHQVLFAWSPHSPGDGIAGSQPLSQLV